MILKSFCAYKTSLALSSIIYQFWPLIDCFCFLLTKKKKKIALVFFYHLPWVLSLKANFVLPLLLFVYCFLLLKKKN